MQTVTGKSWGINLPGHGTFFHQSGNIKQTATVVKQVPGLYDWIDVVDQRSFRGNQTFDVEALCAFFDYRAVFP